MSALDPLWRERAQKALDQLVAQYLDHPAVSMIDVGQDPLYASAMPVLRIHVRGRQAAGLSVPEELEGIPVRLVSGEYELQNDPSAE